MSPKYHQNQITSKNQDVRTSTRTQKQNNSCAIVLFINISLIFKIKIILITSLIGWWTITDKLQFSIVLHLIYNGGHFFIDLTGYVFKLLLFLGIKKLSNKTHVCLFYSTFQLCSKVYISLIWLQISCQTWR